MAGTVIAAALALLPASRMELLTDLPALLPDGAPAAEDYRRFLRLFGGFERVFVIARDGQSPEAEARDRVLRASEWLASELAELPDVAEVEAGVAEEDQEFFLRHVVGRSPLLLEDEDLGFLQARLAPEALDRRARELRSSVHSPTGRLALELAAWDPLGLADRLQVLRRLEGSLPVDPVTSAFLSPDGRSALLVVTPSLGEMDAEGGRRLEADLQQLFRQVGEEVGGAGLELHAVGGPLYAAQDERQIRGDLETTLAGSAIACTVILLLAFGGAVLPTVVMASLGLALAWTAAALALGPGSVTAAGLGFAAVLVGLGVDYGIHGGAAYRRGLLEGASPGGALSAAFQDAGPAILTSAMTTACAFAVLGAAHFRPLRELGIVVAVGITAIFVAFATFGAAALAAFVGPGRGPGFLWRALERRVEGSVNGARRRPRRVLFVAFLVTVASIPGLMQLKLNADLRALRPVDHPAFAAETLLAESFGVGLGTLTVVIPGRDLDEALERASRAAEMLRRVEGGRLSVIAPSDLLVSADRATERLGRLQGLGLDEAADRFEAALRAQNLNPRGFAPGLDALRTLGSGRDLELPAPDERPESLGELLTRDEQGRTWAALRVRLPEGLWPAGPPPDVLAELPEDAAVASVPRLGRAMKELASTDFRRLSWVAGILLAVVVLVSFRGRVVSSLLAMTPPALGSLWMLGLWGATGRSLDLLSLAVVPILLGIGIDDGLHAVHGAHRPGERLPRDLDRSVARAGLAMALTTLTTCAGFGSLAGSSIPGLRYGGILVAGGVCLCFVATLWVLPAVGVLLPAPANDEDP